MTGDTLLSRDEFRSQCLDRDDDTCVVPWCDEPADEVHHIIERSCWSDGGYYLRNGASVCNPHHREAEADYIPPQAFWRWIEVEPFTPDWDADTFESPDNPDAWNVNKWGIELEEPRWKDRRDWVKYQSTPHLPFAPKEEREDNYIDSFAELLNTPVTVTIKMDGANTTLHGDEMGVAARNGREANHEWFSYLKQIYDQDNLGERIPDYMQIAGEWLYGKHSIHYGCDCDPPCSSVGPPLDAYFQVFGVYDRRYDLWLASPTPAVNGGVCR